MLLPFAEAAPVKFTRGADLIGKSEVVDPSFLFCPPTAAPCERKDSRLVPGCQANRPDEIGTPRPPLECYMVDVQFGMVGKHMLEESSDLNARRVAANLKAIGRASYQKPPNVDFKGL